MSNEIADLLKHMAKKPTKKIENISSMIETKNNLEPPDEILNIDNHIEFLRATRVWYEQHPEAYEALEECDWPTYDKENEEE